MKKIMMSITGMVLLIISFMVMTSAETDAQRVKNYRQSPKATAPSKQTAAPQKNTKSSPKKDNVKNQTPPGGKTQSDTNTWTTPTSTPTPNSGNNNSNPKVDPNVLIPAIGNIIVGAQELRRIKLEKEMMESANRPYYDDYDDYYYDDGYGQKKPPKQKRQPRRRNHRYEDDYEYYY